MSINCSSAFVNQMLCSSNGMLMYALESSACDSDSSNVPLSIHLISIDDLFKLNDTHKFIRYHGRCIPSNMISRDKYRIPVLRSIN